MTKPVYHKLVVAPGGVADQDLSRLCVKLSYELRNRGVTSHKQIKSHTQILIGENLDFDR